MNKMARQGKRPAWLFRLAFSAATAVLLCAGARPLSASAAAERPFYSDQIIYEHACDTARSGERDFAFLGFYSLLRYGPASAYHAPALFAVGEYFYRQGMWRDAEIYFREFAAAYPENKAYVFALAYLSAIARQKSDTRARQVIQRTILEVPRLSPARRDFKEISYISALQSGYRARFSIGRVEFYCEGRVYEHFSF
ncbi:MAG: hypothetical protein NC924_05320 [Candidatus Omnitrophica bacterium]|nr:hypothetical protein [Candidatus Omnitrophota bacterium]